MPCPVAGLPHLCEHGGEPSGARGLSWPWKHSVSSCLPGLWVQLVLPALGITYGVKFLGHDPGTSMSLWDAEYWYPVCWHYQPLRYLTGVGTGRHRREFVAETTLGPDLSQVGWLNLPGLGDFNDESVHPLLLGLELLEASIDVLY